jgi:hypothetical protein
MNTPPKPEMYKYSVRKRFFFRQDDDTCYTMETHLRYMKENHINAMDVYLAKRETGSDFFFCKHFDEVGEKAEGGCGKVCEAYQPRNGKSGACKFVGYVYELTDQCFALQVDSVEFVS